VSFLCLLCFYDVCCCFSLSFCVWVGCLGLGGWFGVVWVVGYQSVCLFVCVVILLLVSCSLIVWCLV